MITLTAKINLLSGDNDTLGLGSNDLSGSNISTNLGAVVGVKRKAVNPFVFGVSKLGSGATFESATSFQNRSGGGYYIGNQPSQADGSFATPYTIVINGSVDFSSITFEFDTANKRHPNSIVVDGVTYLDNDAIFTIAKLTSGSSHRITINNWNTANAPIVITAIYIKVEIEIDMRNMISISRSIFDRSDLKLPSFGIISNTGKVEFNDSTGEVADYAEQLLLDKGIRCEIYLNNTLVDGASKLIAEMETDQWNYDNDNRVVSVSIKDDLEEWQDINVASVNYDPRDTTHRAFAWYYNHLWNLTNSNYPMLAFGELDEDTQAVLNKTYIQYPLLESGSLWQQWTKLCQACQLHIYKNSDGVVVCRYNGGN